MVPYVITELIPIIEYEEWNFANFSWFPDKGNLINRDIIVVIYFANEIKSCISRGNFIIKNKKKWE